MTTLPTPLSIETSLRQTLNLQHLEVTGDGQHFEALIVSADFAGLSRIQRHQQVYQALGDRMRAEIHALSMKTLTPEEWQANPR